MPQKLRNFVFLCLLCSPVILMGASGDFFFGFQQNHELNAWKKVSKKQAPPIQHTAAKIPQEANNNVILNEVKGVILVGDPKELITYDLDKYHGVHFHDLDIPKQPRRLQKTLERILIGQPLTSAKILEAEDAIISFYKEWHHPLIVVYAPEQKITDGVLQLVVAETKVGKVTFKGNKWFKTEQLEKNTRINEGDAINSQVMTDDLIWMNRNSFRDTIVVLNPGINKNTTDVEFITKDRRPYRLIAGVDNNGYESTGETRLIAGAQFANLFHLDHSLSYQYTVSTDFGRFYAHTAQYSMPLPWRHILDFYGGYSGIAARMPLKVMENRGRAWQLSFRYIAPLPAYGTYTHEFRWGIDYKQSDVNLVFDAIPIVGNQTVITQAMLGYNSSFEHRVLDMSFELQWFMSPGDIFPHQSAEDYQSLRPFAKSSYTYVRFSTIPIFHLPHDFQAVLKMEFQVASRNLLSSEQFGLGGFNTVRGYDQRVLNADNGLLLSGEIRSPTFRPISKKMKKQYAEVLQFLAFIDYGFGTNHQPAPETKNFRWLLSTGLGMRYYFNSNISARVDWGYPLHKKIQDRVEQNSSKFNFAVIVSF